MAHARAGKPAQIWAKLNALVDRASSTRSTRPRRPACTIDLIVRGMCCLRPGVPGLSENIRVKSIVGRFLEHARIVCFGAGHGLPSRAGARSSSPRPTGCRATSTAGWRALVPIENPTVHQQILDQIMVANLKDERKAGSSQPDGSYVRVVPERGARSRRTATS